MYGAFVQIKALLSEKCMVTPNFLFGYQNHLLKLQLFPHSFKAHKNIPVLVGTTHRKPEYLEMHRTYVQ